MGRKRREEELRVKNEEKRRRETIGRKRGNEELRVKNEENGGGKSTDIDCRAEPLHTGETGEGLPRPPSPAS